MQFFIFMLFLSQHTILEGIRFDYLDYTLLKYFSKTHFYLESNYLRCLRDFPSNPPIHL